jgi:exopolyphosphatase / guanosine-5'-triphosphate,3'-diphosphate pyrophosphatase
MNSAKRLAAVDLGSNSFRLEIGRIDHGQYVRTEYLKETVRQGSGMDESRNLSDRAVQKGLDCLARFGERLAGFKTTEVRAVATQTLREARNRDAFLSRANQVLGFPIDVISGREEARLIYQGVAVQLPQSEERRLVIDIGGRSTELILGQGSIPRQMESYRVGSVAWSSRYFPEGDFTSKAFQAAEIAAKAVMDEALGMYPRDGWDFAYGSAGTVGAVGDVLTEAGWPADAVTQAGLDWMLDKLLQTRHSRSLKITGLKEDRYAIIGGGLSILRALFDLLQIQELKVASGGLRHGLISELMGDASERSYLPSLSIDSMALRFGVDNAQAQRVSHVATRFLDQLLESSNSMAFNLREVCRRKLAWAARLHEIGTLVSHADHHKHGAYIIDNSDAIGLAASELHRLSQLVLGHRGKLRKLDVNFDDESFILQLMALRIAVILCHARRDPDIDNMKLALSPSRSQEVCLTCGSAWASTYPQSAHLLNEEVLAWQKTRWSLNLMVG